jgi:hypothetical protein
MLPSLAVLLLVVETQAEENLACLFSTAGSFAFSVSLVASWGRSGCSSVTASMLYNGEKGEREVV